MRRMYRRMLLLALATLPLVAAVPAAAQGVNVSAINSYLRGLRTASGAFRQVNPNGSVQTGRFYMARPGRIRFEYDAPRGSLVVADGSWVGVFDPKSNRNPQRYPLSKTPLSLLLRDDISLAEKGLVLGAERDKQGMHVTVVDPRQPQEGRIVMSFAEDPIALRGWTVTTKTGQRTQVTVSDLRTGMTFDRGLFNIELATANHGG
jgi:outer membrane lipoprotein-sorting protein